MNSSVAVEEALKWLGYAFGVVAAGFALWKRASADYLAKQKNTGEGSWIERLAQERDDCVARERRERELHREREVNDAKVIAELQLRNALLLEKLERMAREISVIKKVLLEHRPDLARIINSDFGALDEPS